jgi:hypothetical protein
MKMMKRTDRSVFPVRFRALAVLAVLAVVLVLAGCPTDEKTTVTVAQRIDQFENDINNGGAAAGQNFHSTTEGRAGAQTASFWQAYFPTDNSQSYTIGAPVGGTNNVFTASLSGGDLYSGTDTLTFEMLQEGENVWMILSLQLNGNPILPPN